MDQPVVANNARGRDAAEGVLRVTSETAPLRQVVVHTPGEEMALVSPENKLELLFDDILFTERAEAEHAVMCRLFHAAVGEDDAVVQIGGLLREAFDEEAARDEFVELLAERIPERNYAAYADDLRRLSPDELHRFALTGRSPLPIRAQPIPNLMFTRDLAAVVGGHIILSHAATLARARDSIVVRVVLRHHPRFAGVRDRLIELPPHVSFEGGDLLVVDERTVLVGNSERTSLGGVMAITQALFERTGIENVVMVNLPKARYCMHLDTVFTFASPTECVEFPPVIEGGRSHIMHFTKADADPERPAAERFHTAMWPDVKTALEALTEREMTFIRCGGEELIHQRREQWTDGANLFALAPGVVVSYERNQRTAAALRDHGYHTVEAGAFLDYHGGGPIPQDRKVAIQLRGHELSRGRGGPRCMTMPLLRGPLPGANGTTS